MLFVIRLNLNFILDRLDLSKHPGPEMSLCWPPFVWERLNESKACNTDCSKADQLFHFPVESKLGQTSKRLVLWLNSIPLTQSIQCNTCSQNGEAHLTFFNFYLCKTRIIPALRSRMGFNEWLNSTLVSHHQVKGHFSLCTPFFFFKHRYPHSHITALLRSIQPTARNTFMYLLEKTSHIIICF